MKKFLGLITRCKDEFFIKEFVEYYLNEGVDHIYVIDDNSYNKDIYNEILFYKNVSVLFEKNIKDEAYEANRLYRKIRRDYEWMIFLDVDEYITPKKNPFNTLKEELANHFSPYDCVKVPWVMMSSGGRDENPVSILRDNVWRWDHDKRHPHALRKFKCRYDRIEVKSIFRPEKFLTLDLHFPTDTTCDVDVVDSVTMEEDTLSHFYNNFREEKINEAYLVCYHHRMISKENSLNKIKYSNWYHDFSIDELMDGDHAEVIDNTLSVRQFRKKIFIIGFDLIGANSIHNFFKKNGLASIHWDETNLARSMLTNRQNGNKLLSTGETTNKQANSNIPYRKAQVLSGMAWSEKNLDAKDFYQDLDRQYPNSIFILNVCNVDTWIESRKKHYNGETLKAQKIHHGADGAELETIWRDMWHTTINEMKAHFHNRNNFMIYDVESHTETELQAFFKNDMMLNLG